MMAVARGTARLLAKQALYPGLDVHTRCRYRFLPRFFRPGPISTLDAGCGNGALAYAAYRRGNRALGVSRDAHEVARTQAFFAHLGVHPPGLEFAVCNLYDLPQLGRRFDQIICSETLEHIIRDDIIVRHFYDILNPGGVLHLCCPFGEHPVHRNHRLGATEDGGHVRRGYTLETYRGLPKPVGFHIVDVVGLGSPLLVRIDSVVRRIRNRRGEVAATPVFLLTWPLQYLDYLNPPVPFSLYVQAVKRAL